MPNNTHVFRPGQSAHDVNQAIKSSLHTLDEAKKCAVLWFEEILERKLYRELGYSSINQYAKQELGFSTSRTGDFLQLCRTFKRLPKVKEKVKSGELGYTSARVLAQVANESNEEVWLDFALKNSRRDLERETKRAKRDYSDQVVGQPLLIPEPVKDRPAAVLPVRLSLEMTPTQLARYEVLWEQIRKRGDVADDKVEAMLEIMDAYVAESSPRGELQSASKPPAQIHIHQCPDCNEATVQTGKGELEIGADELERALCDCQLSKPGQRNTTSIPPMLRRAVLSRARRKCQRTGCDHTRFLEVHHKVPRSLGGANDLDNCICLCSGCHGLVHGNGNVGMLVKSPTAAYKWHSSGLQD